MKAETHAEMLGINMRLLELESPDQPIQMMIKLRGWNSKTKRLLDAEKAFGSTLRHAGVEK